MITRNKYKMECGQCCERDKNEVLQSIGDIFVCRGEFGKDSSRKWHFDGVSKVRLSFGRQS